MNAGASLVVEVTALGGSLVEEAGRIVCRAPRGTLSPAIRAALREHRDAVLEEVRAGRAPLPSPLEELPPLPPCDLAARVETWTVPGSRGASACAGAIRAAGAGTATAADLALLAYWLPTLKRTIRDEAGEMAVRELVRTIKTAIPAPAAAEATRPSPREPVVTVLFSQECRP